MGGYGAVHTDSISQLVTIPAASSATLSYYVHIDTNETPASASYDTLSVTADSTSLQTLSNLDAATGYQLKTLDLSAYAGQTITLSFTDTEDASAATSFVIDDTSLTTPAVATAPGAPTAVTGTPGNSQASVSWAAPASNGGSPVTGYTVTASPGGATATTSGATTATVTGLANGTAYTFTVTATNSKGVSVGSEASTAVTPSAASSTTTPAATTTTPAPTSTTPGTGVIPIGAPNTGAGGSAGSSDGLMSLGGLALLLGGAGATLVVRRRLQA